MPLGVEFRKVNGTACSIPQGMAYETPRGFETVRTFHLILNYKHCAADWKA
jgi:hypothetical protein